MPGDIYDNFKPQKFRNEKGDISGNVPSVVRDAYKALYALKVDLKAAHTGASPAWAMSYSLMICFSSFDYLSILYRGDQLEGGGVSLIGYRLSTIDPRTSPKMENTQIRIGSVARTKPLL